MKTPTKVSSTVEKAHLDKAMRQTGKTKSETIRIAIKHFIGKSVTAAPISEASDTATTDVPTVAVAVAPVGGKLQSDMTVQELGNCEDVLFSAEEGINNAIVLLKMKIADPNPPPEVDAVEENARLNIVIADLEQRVFDIGQKINAISVGNLTMTPPTAAAIATISRLTDSVGQMTAEAQDADTIITAAKQLAGSIKGMDA